MHWPVIAAWIVAVVLLALGSRAVGEQNSDNLSLPGTGSTKAQDLLQDKLPRQAYGTSPVVLEAAFASFVLNGNAIVKQFGVGLAVAIAIDATMSVASPCRQSWRFSEGRGGGCRGGSIARSHE